MKAYLRELVASCGFKHGTKGVLDYEVEVFPKNDRVGEGSLGNLVALPFARKSVPLDAELQPIAWDHFVPPQIEDLYNPDIVSVFEPPAPKPHTPSRETSPSTQTVVPSEVLPGDENEVREALKFIDADDYDTWIIIALGIKNSFGAAGLYLFDEWSSKSPKYKGYDEAISKWDSLDPDGSVTIATIFKYAKDGGWAGPSNAVVREMNSRFGILTYGSTTRIILKSSGSGEVLTWLGKGAFEDRLAPEKFAVTDDNGEVSWRPKARYWLRHPLAAHYHALEFDPSMPPGHNGNIWNMWHGFPIVPRAGEWGRLKEHIFENVCRGNQGSFDWLMSWQALGVQEPALVIGTAPVLKGLPGTGKGVLANAYGRLWMPHFVSITKDDHVRGRFNQHLEGRRFVYVDEAM